MADADQTTEPATPEQPVDWADAIASALDEQDDTPATPPADDAVEATAEEEDVDIDLEDDEDDVDETSEADDADADGEAETEAYTAPDEWSDAAKAAFAELPAEAQSALLEREQQAAAGLQQREQAIAQREGVVNALEAVLQPYMPDMQAAGADPVSTIQQLFEANKVLMENPRGGLKWLAQQLSVDLVDLITDDESADVNPEVVKLQQQIHQLKGQISTRENADVKAVRDQAVAEVEAFRSATGDDGQPLHPYFDEVRQHAGQLVAAGTAATIEDAYNQAVWANPATRKKMLEMDKAKEVKARKAKARAARKSGRLPSAAPGDVKAKPTAPASWEDAVSQAMDQHAAA